MSALQLLMDGILFDVDKKRVVSDKNSGGIKVSHTYVIKEMVVPEEYKNDFAAARIHAKRMGVIRRVVEVDGEKVIEKEKGLLV